VQLSMALEDSKARDVVVPCFIVPPYGAGARGGFAFKAVTNYSDHLSTNLGRATKGAPCTIGVLVLQNALELDGEQQATLEFVARLEAGEPEDTGDRCPAQCGDCGQLVDPFKLAGIEGREGLYCQKCYDLDGLEPCEHCGEFKEPTDLANGVNRAGRFCDSCQDLPAVEA
jgi:hypothetical protein